MTTDLNLTITSIIALCAIASPCLVTILNNRHNLKIRRLEINSKTKQEILENFAYYINQVHFCDTVDELELHKYANLLHIYFAFDEMLFEKILNRDYQFDVDFRLDVAKLLNQLAKQINYK